MRVLIASLVILAAISANGLLKKFVHPLSDEMIDRINESQSSWKAGRNFYPSELERVIKMLGVKTEPKVAKLPVLRHENIGQLPDNFDARTNWPECPTISEIRDQGACGSCWAFGAVEAMSDRYCIASGGKTVVQISAEDLISCCQGFFACGSGCDGGHSSKAWSYWVKTGIVSGGLYNTTVGCRPYTIATCRHGTNSSLPPCTDIVDTPDCTKRCEPTFTPSYQSDLHKGLKVYSIDQDVAQIQQEIMTNGPVEADMNVFADFVNYKSGVYIKTSTHFLGKHAVRLLGWGTENGVPYWLGANSWNAYWGDHGFFKIRRGNNEVMIEEDINAGTPKI
ncbi:Cathepsin B [Halotydeus destructor]|nr:Cathepsin B [Halotydeus destructor]